MSKYQPIKPGELFVGADRDIQFTILDRAGDAVNITGYSVEWALYENSSDATPKVVKVSPSEIELTDPGAGILKVHVLDSDTAGLTGDLEYFHVLRRTDAGNEVVMAHGTAWLTYRAK